jgi:MYXO-CTERM domain-containing protein
MTDLHSRRRARRRLGALLAALPLAAIPGTAEGYTISNELSTGCHEDITSVALRVVRKELPTAAPLPVTADERALVDDLEFAPDADMKDLGGATLLAAVRDNDLKGLSSDDLTALAQVHGDPANQQEHCLRGADQKEPGGTKLAVDACRAFIRARAVMAVGGLDDKGMPDLGKRTEMTINLSIRGSVHPPLPTYYVAAGQAIHAIEDSFTHTYRTADERRITVALDWLDEVNGTLVESRDGPGHAKELDRCDDPDDLRKTRRLLAIEAASDFLRATLDPQKTPDQKMAAVDAMLDAYLAYEPGCTFDNGWCNAAESKYKDTAGCGCSLGNVGGGGGAALAGAAVVTLAVARRVKRRRRAARGLAALGVATALSLAAADAQAQPAPAPTTTTTTTPAHDATPPTTTKTTTTPSDSPDTPPTTATVQTTPTTTTTTVTAPAKPGDEALPAPTVVPVAEPGPVDPSQVAVGGYAGISGSIEKPALAGAVGARLRVSKAWAFGLDGEWNPWIAFNGTPVRKGVFNVYGTAMLRFPLAYENFNLRVSASLGMSYLLDNFFGAPMGTVGLFVGASPLSVEWKLSRAFYLILNPIHFAMPIPQLSGVPLLYPQYRSTIGFEVYAG